MSAETCSTIVRLHVGSVTIGVGTMGISAMVHQIIHRSTTVDRTFPDLRSGCHHALRRRGSILLERRPVKEALFDELVVRGEDELQVVALRLRVVVALVEADGLQRRARLLGGVGITTPDEVGAADLGVGDAAAERAAGAVEEEDGLRWPNVGVVAA